jgi:hypothetical protein
MLADEERARNTIVKEIQTSAVEDRFWISIRGPLKDQARALQLLLGVMKELPEVNVALGTRELEF